MSWGYGAENDTFYLAIILDGLIENIFLVKWL